MELKLPAYSYYYIYNTKNALKRLLFFQPRHRHQRMGSWHPHGQGHVPTPLLFIVLSISHLIVTRASGAIPS